MPIEKQNWEEILEDVINESFSIIDSNGNGINHVVNFVKKLFLEKDQELIEIILEKLTPYPSLNNNKEKEEGYNEAVHNVVKILKSLLDIDEK